MNGEAIFLIGMGILWFFSSLNDFDYDSKMYEKSRCYTRFAFRQIWVILWIGLGIIGMIWY